MSFQVIPTQPDSFYDHIVTLEGTDYKLTWNYNQREDCYYLSISTPDGTDLVKGIKVVANWPLLHKWAVTGLPPGELICLANTPTTDPAPGLGQIGTDAPFTLIYATSNQLP